MLVKVNSIDEDKKIAKVTILDIDDYGSIIPLRESEFRLPADDNSVIQILKSSFYASIFTSEDYDNDSSTIMLANAITLDELNDEKKKTIDKIMGKK